MATQRPGMFIVPMLASAVLLATTAILASGCDTNPGGSPQISFELNQGMSSWLTARDRAIGSVLLARDQLKASDLRTIEVDYTDAVGDANGWIESVSIGIRGATLDSPQADEAYRQKAVASAAKVDTLVADVRKKVLAYTSSGSTGVTTVGALDEVTGAGAFIMKTMDWIFNHKVAEARLRAIQQAERDRLADEVLRCGTWPNWQNITKDYKASCETIIPGPQQSPILLPSGNPRR